MMPLDSLCDVPTVAHARPYIVTGITKRNERGDLINSPFRVRFHSIAEAKKCASHFNHENCTIESEVSEA